MNKVLFITYFWPPSGKATLHWPLDIIRHLPKDEIEPVILTVEDESFTQKDESLLKKVDPGWKVLKSGALEPFDLYRKFIGKKKDEKLTASETVSLENKSLTHRISLWIRLNLFIPDARVGWNFTAVKKAKSYIKQNKINAIVSIGPPHSSHLIGLKLSRKFQISHIPVLIDPWVDIIYYKNLKRSSITKKIDNHFEKSVLRNAKQVVFVTKTTEEDYLKKYEFLKDKSHVLYWGYDEEEFEDVDHESIKKDYKLIIHAGNIFDYQNPAKLWQRIKEENKRENIRIKFIGTVSPAIKKAIEQNGLSDKTDYAGFLPYNQMLTELLNADYLLVCATEKRHVPGKLFEYLRTGKPILAFGDDNKEVKEILQRTNSGMIFRYDADPKDFFEKSQNFKTDFDEVKKFDRRSIAENFGKILSHNKKSPN